MKTIAFLLLSFSFSAFACPNLSGNYAVCRSTTGASSGATDLVITQSIVKRVTHYSVTSTDSETQDRISETYKADGKTYTVTQNDPETGMSLVLQTTASCQGNVLNVRVKALFDSQALGDVTMKISKEGSALKQVVTGQSLGEELSETVICE